MISKGILYIVVLFINHGLYAQYIPVDTLQKYGIYDTDRLSPSFHKSRRDSIRKVMANNSIALFASALIKNRANDVNYEYHQDPDFFYLTGHLEPNAALILLKTPYEINGVSTNEIFFTQRRDPKREVWDGPRLGEQGVRSVLHIENVFPIDSLSAMLSRLLPRSDTFYYTPPVKAVKEHSLDTTYIVSDDILRRIKEKYPALITAKLTSRLAQLRMLKSEEELYFLRKAISITCEAHNTIMKSVKPGWTEYQIQSLGEYVFKNNGCEYTGYPCIVGSGNNSTILHYVTNRRTTVDGDFIEMDIGGEYRGYTADVTRSFPVNGKFTKEQRSIYDLVLEAQDSGIANAKKGKPFRSPHNAAVSVIKRGLRDLGIITDSSDFMRYFMHGTSHYLGLDVHDPGTYGLLEPNVVITVEPGIYIAEGSPCDPKWWKIGCRIEDDILITEDGNENLSRYSPRTADEIEQLMHSGK